MTEELELQNLINQINKMDTSEKQIIELEGHVKEFWRQRKSREKIANKLRNMEERVVPIFRE